MSTVFISDREYTKINSSELSKGTYEECQFINCDFSNSDLSSYKFITCDFEECNFSLSKLNNSILQTVRFNQCKMIGIHFEYANPFGLEIAFDHCNLNHCSFYQLKLKGTPFLNCEMNDVDFTEADLSSSSFHESDLSSAIFEQSNLEKCDFSSATGFIINPKENKLKQAIFSLEGLPGLLQNIGIQIK